VIDGGPAGPEGCARGVEGSIGFEVAVCDLVLSREWVVEELWKKVCRPKTERSIPTVV